MSNITTWKELKNNLSINQEDQNAIALEKDLIRTMAAIREEKGLTQAQKRETKPTAEPETESKADAVGCEGQTVPVSV